MIRLTFNDNDDDDDVDRSTDQWIVCVPRSKRLWPPSSKTKTKNGFLLIFPGNYPKYNQMKIKFADMRIERVDGMGMTLLFESSVLAFLFGRFDFARCDRSSRWI